MSVLIFHGCLGLDFRVEMINTGRTDPQQGVAPVESASIDISTESRSSRPGISSS